MSTPEERREWRYHAERSYPWGAEAKSVVCALLDELEAAEHELLRIPGLEAAVATLTREKRELEYAATRASDPEFHAEVAVATSDAYKAIAIELAAALRAEHRYVHSLTLGGCDTCALLARHAEADK